MINQRISPGKGRLLARAGVLVGAALWFVLLGSPATHADDVGLLGDAAQIVEGAAEQAVEPVVQTAESAVQQPVEQAVEPAVQQVVEPVVPAAEQSVEAVVRVVEPAVHQAVEPVVEVGPVVEPAVESVVESAPVPAPQDPIIGSPNGTHTVGVSDHGGEHVHDGAKGPTDEQRHSEAAHRTYPTDVAPRAMGGPGILRHSGEGDDQSGNQGTDPALWTLTNALMHLYAGDQLPGAINAGLPGGVLPARTPWIAPLMLGLMLGFLSLVLARRRLG